MGRLGGRVFEVMGDDPEDLVISNMAPKYEWCKVGEAVARHLCELALDLASRERVACAGVPIRVLRGAGFDPRHGQALACFDAGQRHRPRSSRFPGSPRGMKVAKGYSVNLRPASRV